MKKVTSNVKIYAKFPESFPSNFRITSKWGQAYDAVIYVKDALAKAADADLLLFILIWCCYLRVNC